MTAARRQILFYGDSNTYGYDPADKYENRYPENARWIDILSKELGDEWTVQSDAMNGRRIPDLQYDADRIDRMLGRLKTRGMLAVMLGTNDILLTIKPDAAIAIQKMASFLSYLCIQKRPEDILVIAPPYLAKTYDTGFLDAGLWNVPLCFDMVHFSEKGHRMFAEKIRGYLKEMQP